MRNEFKAICGRVSSMKPGVVHELYHRIVGDASAANSSEEAEVDKHVQIYLNCGDEDMVWENAGRPEKYTACFEGCELFEL